MSAKWNKLDPNTTQQFPLRLTAEDECYYAREYKAGGTYKDSQGNQDISNFKKHPKHTNSPQWHYKKQAIAKFATELASLLSGAAHIAAIPTSKTPDDPEYDFRFEDTLSCLKRLKPTITIHMPFRITESHQAAHLGGKRSERFFYELLVWEGFDRTSPHIVLIDDVLTTGSHFAACKRKILEHCPGLRVIGVFWVKVVWPE